MQPVSRMMSSRSSADRPDSAAAAARSTPARSAKVAEAHASWAARAPAAAASTSAAAARPATAKVSPDALSRTFSTPPPLGARNSPSTKTASFHRFVPIVHSIPQSPCW